MTSEPKLTMTYEQAIAYVASLAPRGWRLGLDRMEELVRRAGVADAVGSPDGPQFIHVAGTNGKGSVTAYLQSMLVESGYRTGAFFSPFVYDIRERVQYDRQMISKHDMVRLTEALKPIEESFADTDFGGVTEFEFKAALGFRYWKEHSCDWVALEVGLGGRLDATNVVTPKASVVVSIGLDHTGILGDTRAEIAYEKAGIVKPGVPVIIGRLAQDALEVVEKEAALKEAEAWRYGREIQVELELTGRHFTVHTPARSHKNLRPGMVGNTQIHNMALAVAAFDASGAFRNDKAVHDGARTASLPGRFERRVYQGCDVVLDGAHNVEAAEVLADTLEHEFPGRRLVLITGMVAGHEPGRFYAPLAHLVDVAHVAPIHFHRALPTEEVAAALADQPFEVQSHNEIESAIAAACRDAGEDDLVVVTGSFYLVGEVGRLLKSEGR